MNNLNLTHRYVGKGKEPEALDEILKSKVPLYLGRDQSGLFTTQWKKDKLPMEVVVKEGIQIFISAETQTFSKIQKKFSKKE